MHSISELKDIADDAIRNLSLHGEPYDLYDPVTYMLSLDAKRIRPVLTLAACELFHGDISEALPPAIGLEIFHNFTLLHDDIMDNAPLRRAQPTVHQKWSPNVALLSGDAMFVIAGQLMMKSPDRVLRSVLEIYHQTAIEVCEGQQLDMEFEKSSSVTVDDYIKMISLKTAVLPAACLKTGALIAGATDKQTRLIYDFGKNIGIAFQLMDDLLDVFGDGAKVGKVKGGDIVANKKTFLLIKAMELAKGVTINELQQLVAGTHPDKVERVTTIFEELGVRLLAEKEMEKYFYKALHCLKSIDVPEERKSVLEAFAGTLMKRES